MPTSFRSKKSGRLNLPAIISMRRAGRVVARFSQPRLTLGFTPAQRNRVADERSRQVGGIAKVGIPYHIQIGEPGDAQGVTDSMPARRFDIH